jgi:hypothetical protein
MGIEIGNPVNNGFGSIYEVPAVRRSSAGRITASAIIIVDIGDVETDGMDIAALKRAAKQKALAMIDEDPSLLAPETFAPGGTHHPDRDDGDTPPWDGDGFLDAPDDDGPPDEPKRILSPDSPLTGGF